MRLTATLFGERYSFRDIKDLLAKANEEKSGDQLAGVAAETAAERMAAEFVLAEVPLETLRDNPAVPVRRGRGHPRHRRRRQRGDLRRAQGLQVGRAARVAAGRHAPPAR